MGFDGIFVGESPSTLPSPFVCLAALASTTARIRLGTLATVPAFRHPVQLVQQLEQHAAAIHHCPLFGDKVDVLEHDDARRELSREPADRTGGAEKNMLRNNVSDAGA